jgi:type II secretory pathway component GspD/PulD (secretin)
LPQIAIGRATGAGAESKKGKKADMMPLNRCRVFSIVLLVIGLCAVGQAQEENVNQAFDVSGLNERLNNEAGLSPEQSREWITSRVSPLIAFPGNQSLTSTQIEIEGVKLNSDSTRRGVVVIRDKLHVVAPKEEQKKVREFVDTFTRFGVRQIEIRTHVYRDTATAMKALPIQWSHVEAATNIAASSSPNAVRPASHAQPLTLTSKYIESQKPPVKEDLPPPEGVNDATWMQATSIVERSTPVLYSLLSPAEHAAVIAQARKQATLECLMAPTVLVFNGQIASMSNAVERPFVTGIKVMKFGPEHRQQVEFAPNVKVYQEGTTMKIRPEIVGGKSVRLNCQLDLCKIRSVETQPIPGIEGRGEFNVQMPEVALTKFRTCLDMPVGYTLAVTAFETDEAGVKHSTVILCNCDLHEIAN